jgi:hypothetical protein
MVVSGVTIARTQNFKKNLRKYQFYNIIPPSMSPYAQETLPQYLET